MPIVLPIPTISSLTMSNNFPWFFSLIIATLVLITILCKYFLSNTSVLEVMTKLSNNISAALIVFVVYARGKVPDAQSQLDTDSAGLECIIESLVNYCENGARKYQLFLSVFSKVPAASSHCGATCRQKEALTKMTASRLSSNPNVTHTHTHMVVRTSSTRGFNCCAKPASGSVCNYKCKVLFSNTCDVSISVGNFSYCINLCPLFNFP